MSNSIKRTLAVISALVGGLFIYLSVFVAHELWKEILSLAIGLGLILGSMVTMARLPRRRSASSLEQ